MPGPRLPQHRGARPSRSARPRRKLHCPLRRARVRSLLRFAVGRVAEAGRRYFGGARLRLQPIAASVRNFPGQPRCRQSIRAGVDPTLVLHLAEQRDAFTIERVGRRIISLLAGEATEIGKRAGDSPAIIERMKHRERSFIERACASGVSLLAGDIALIVQGPGDAFAVAERAKCVEAFGVKGTRAFVFALSLATLARLLSVCAMPF